ncbi:hypothetical protein J6P92_01395 [bacterium]|nr:hypothetical protein [bacterium]
MDISLSSDNEKFLQSQITAGIYKTLSDAINANLSIIISTEQTIPQDVLQRFKDDVQKGLDDVNAGRVSDCIEFMDSLIEEDMKNTD